MRDVAKACAVCGETGHREWQCDKDKLVTFQSKVSCQICGDGGHPTIDCPRKHSGTDLGQVCTFGEMCYFLPWYRESQNLQQIVAMFHNSLTFILFSISVSCNKGFSHVFLL
jgi:hypothetical protein